MTPGPSGPGRVQRRVEGLLGPDAVEVRAERVVVAPSTTDETAELFRVGAEEGWRVRPTGAGAGLDLLPGGGRAGNGAPSLSPADLLLSSRRLAGIREYEPADLTVQVGAGTTLADLDRTVAEQGQWLPLDPPGGARVTVGGMLAMGTAGSLEVGFGRPRDQVLGLTLVDGRGRLLALGGRVVKNVAGFDLVRLTTGSRGALGMIHEAVLRLFPRPEVDRTLIWPSEDRGSAVELGRRLAGLAFPLGALEMVEGIAGATAAREEGGTGVLLRLVDREPVARRIQAEAVQVAGTPGVVLEAAESSGLWERLGRREGDGRPHLRLNVLPARLPSLVAALDPILPAGAQNPSLAVHLTTGGVRVWGEAVAEDFSSLVRALSGELDRLGGTLRVLRGAGEEGGVGRYPAPGASPAVARLHRELRESFDPEGILPGAWREGWS